MNSDILNRLKEIVGDDAFSRTINLTFPHGMELPSCVIHPSSSHEIQQIIKLANKKSFRIHTISSGFPHHSSRGIKGHEYIIMDLSKMNRILRIDVKNRVAMIEPGVTFELLIPKLESAGLRLLLPLLPRAGKSVLAAYLDRVPITIPRFHWDSSDPLLCTEVVFGSGDLFRTGSAAGPGSLEEQWSSGQAQKNPMGPSQFDPYRLIQGSQGTIGIVTWGTIKCESLPTYHEVYMAGSDTIDPLIEFSYSILRRRLLDEHLLMNDVYLSHIVESNAYGCETVRSSLPKWILIAGVSGTGPIPLDEFEYKRDETFELAEKHGIELAPALGKIHGEKMKHLLTHSSLKNDRNSQSIVVSKKIFFITTLDQTPFHVSKVEKCASEYGTSTDNLGVYLQPIVQGVNTHCEFDIYYDSSDQREVRTTERFIVTASRLLLDLGAFFSRPYGAISDMVFEKASKSMVESYYKVKSIFDPNNILNPGYLCFGRGNQ